MAFRHGLVNRPSSEATGNLVLCSTNVLGRKLVLLARTKTAVLEGAHILRTAATRWGDQTLSWIAAPGHRAVLTKENAR